MGYPGALGIDLSNESGNWPAILKKVEDAVIAAGGKDRMGTWAFSYGYTNSAALAEFGKRIVEGKAKLDKWNAAYYTDAGTGVRNKKFVLVRQDTYVFGKGTLGMTDVEIPEKYFSIGK